MEGDRLGFITTAVRLVGWVRTRRRPFTVLELAGALELVPRTAHRWVAALEAARLVELDTPSRGTEPALWRASPAP